MPLALAALVGCSSFGAVEEYQRSASIKSMGFPEGVNSVALPPLYPIPPAEVKEAAFYNIETDGFVVPRPEPMSAEREKSKVKIQKVGDRRWILVEASTSQVWPLTQNFLMQYDVGASRSQPVIGLIDTEGVVFRDDPNTTHQYRIRIEQGVREETTEVHVLQRTLPGGKGANAQWADKSLDPAREEWLLNELANSLAGNVGNRAASLLGQQVGGEIKAELFMDGKEPALLLRLDEQRAWATMAHAVNKDKFFLWDESSEQQVFYIQHEDLVPKRNWFLRLFLGEFAHGEKRPFDVSTALSHLSETSEARSLFSHISKAQFSGALPEGKGLLVVLYKREGDVVVKVRDFAGRLLPLKENKTYLAVMRRHLI